jgi:hypothetical protein
MSIRSFRPQGVIDVVEAGQLDRLPASMAWVEGSPAGAVIGSLVVPGSTVVGVHALSDLDPRHCPLVFAMALPDSPPRFVTVSPTWSAPFPGGRQGAFALAEALRDGINRAFPPGRPDLIPLVATIGDRALAVVWSGAVQARVTVGPVLDNPAFELLARPGMHPSAGGGGEAAIVHPTSGPPAIALVAGGVVLAMSVSSHSALGAVAAVFLCGIGLVGVVG